MNTSSLHAPSIIRITGRIASVLAALCVGAAAHATTLSTAINVDNGFTVYISTSDSAAGTAFDSEFNWGITSYGTTTLAAGVDYYLHVYGYDVGGPAAFLGQFTLSAGTHLFANNSTTLLTNTTDWKGNTVGFNGSYGAVTSYGTNGVGPWGFRPGMPGTAEWIWVGDNYNNDYAYFSTKITAQNVPDRLSTALAILLAFAGMAAGRRRFTA